MVDSQWRAIWMRVRHCLLLKAYERTQMFVGIGEGVEGGGVGGGVRDGCERDGG